MNSKKEKKKSNHPIKQKKVFEINMRVFGIYVFNASNADSPHIVAKAVDLSSFGFFQRSSAEEIMNFVSRSVAKKTRSAPQSVEHLDYVAYAHQFTESSDSSAPAVLCSAVLTDKEYPPRVAAHIAALALRQFRDLHSAAATAAGGGQSATVHWRSVSSDSPLFDAEFTQLLTKSQTPEAVDDIEHIRKDLDQTQETLHKTIKDLLVRGEKLDDLADQSEDLGVFSREFLKKSESMNQCCLLL